MPVGCGEARTAPDSTNVGDAVRYAHRILPSYNTQTRRLTAAMFQAVFRRIQEDTSCL